jgi:sugar phosphate isomerase/epimerase
MRAPRELRAGVPGGIMGAQSVRSRQPAIDLQPEDKRMAHPQLGVSLHTIASEPSDAVLEAIESSAIATLEVMDRLVDEAPDLRARLAAFVQHSRVRAVTIHARFGQAYDISSPDAGIRQEGLAAVHAAVDTAIELRAPMIVVHASAEPILPEERADRLQRAQAALQDLGARCAAVGVQTAIELLPRTCLGNTVEELSILLDVLPRKVFGVCLDTNHLMDRAQDLARLPGALGNKLLTLHMSDYDGVDEQHQMPGQGVLDWQAFMHALERAGYAGPYNYECHIDGETPQDRIEALERNWRWLSAL